MTNSFFRGKRPWSNIKDQVLGSYMPPYLSKVAKLNKPILIVDAFAGPGKFEDGAAGSPLIICQMAEKHAKNKYLVVFVNKNIEEHNSLRKTLHGFIEKDKAIVMVGTAEELLREIHQSLEDATLFLYLDPFGLKGCEFGLLEPYFRRNKLYSTEVVINISVPAIHRLAARNAIRSGEGVTSKIDVLNKTLSRVLGGDYWQEIMWSDYYDDPEQRVAKVVSMYKEKIQSYGLPYSGSCPVREKEGKAVKYFITFFSRHHDAMLLMNDIMCKAYHRRMHEASTEGTLFERTDWENRRSLRSLAEVVIETIRENPRIRRSQLWLQIVQEHFMKYLAKEYKGIVRNLYNQGIIDFVDVRSTGRLNDESLLFIKTSN